MDGLMEENVNKVRPAPTPKAPKPVYVREVLPYVTKILKEKLSADEKNLKFFENNLKSSDADTVRQAEGSIPSCMHRIEELKIALEHLLLYKK